MDFVSLFVDYYKDYESPTAFWKWGAFAIIASALRSRVFYQYKAGKIYPNIYVVFLADSAEYRKGAPIKAAKKLISLTRATRVFAGTASVQALLDDLSQDIADKKSGVPIKGGSSLIACEELAAFFVEDKRLIPILTDIWDYYEEYCYKLKSGSVVVKDLCTTLLAASNETFLREVYDSRAVYGGLLGRTFLIKPDETRPPNSLVNEGVIDESLLKPLIDALTKIRELKGNIILTDGAKTYYDTWYNDLYSKYKTHPDRTGVMQRMHTNVFKLAIILAAARSTLVISEEIFEQAILEVTSLKNNYDVYVMSSGKTDTAVIATKFLTELYMAPARTITRAAFMVKYWMEVDIEPFDALLVKLEVAGFITTTASKNEVAYKLTPKGINYIQEKK